MPHAASRKPGNGVYTTGHRATPLTTISVSVSTPMNHGSHPHPGTYHLQLHAHP